MNLIANINVWELQSLNILEVGYFGLGAFLGL